MPDGIKPVPSLIIGVGGTGVWTATYVLKDLLEITGTNELPRGVAVLAFDTEGNNRVKVGGWGRSRQTGGPHVGAVQLDQGQYVYVGGDVTELAREVAIGQHPYLGKWWNARGYLDDSLPADLWSLNKGAGQYRQFGRLALFQNFPMATRLITSAIDTIKRGAPGTELYVHIVGSFVGGTGAGLFSDMAHVVAVLARQRQISQLSVRGYFALVDAFLGTPQVDMNDPRKKATYQAQSYACLRECSRLVSATNWATGYPMHYADSGDDMLLRGKLTKRPYDAVYLFDGHRVNNPLVNSHIDEGVAPTIADAIVAHVDEKSGNTFVAHTVNSDKQRVSFHIPEESPTYGTLGTFTFVLPIFHIVEEWTHRLAKETLDELLVPTSFSQDTGVPNGTLAPNQRGGIQVAANTNGAEKGVEWLTKSAPTKFIRDLGSIGERHSRQTSERDVEVELRARSADTWITLLKPESMDAAVGDKIERADVVLASDITKEKVKIAGQTEENEYYVNPNPGGNDRDQAGVVVDDVRQVFNKLVGEEDEEMVRRSGGQVKATLDDLKETHIKQFRNHLRLLLDKELNGLESSDALEAKGGKIGYVLAYLTAVRDTLREAQSAVEMTEGGQQFAGTTQKRRAGSRRQDAQNLIKDAQDKMNKGGGLLGRNRGAYVAAAQGYLQVLKSEIAERVAHKAVQDLIKVADDALAKMTAWAEALAFRSAKEGGMYALVLEGRSSNKNDREHSAKTQVREQVNDKEYEELKYQEYLGRGGLAGMRTQLKNLLSELTWAVRTNESTGAIDISLKLIKGDNAKSAVEFSQEKRQVNGETNTNAFLDRCRQVFNTAWNDMSVLRYLLNKFGNDIPSLAERIYSCSGPLLNVRGDPLLPANFIRVHYESVSQASAVGEAEAKSQQGFLTQLVNELAKKSKVQVTRSSTDQGATKFADFTDSGDRFKLSFVYFSELHQLKDMYAYTAAVGDYRGYMARQRTYLHIFPAEEHAVTLEAQLGQMKPSAQRPRELEDRVVVQLEDLDRFKFITRCLAYGNANYEWPDKSGIGLLLYRVSPRDMENPNNQHVFRMTVEPKGETRGNKKIDPMTGQVALAKHWNLTDLARDPSLLEAYNQFNYKKFAFGNDSDPLDDERIKETLELAIEMDRARRVEDGTLGWYTPDTWSPDRIKETQKCVAQYVKYQEVMEVWQRDLQQYYKDAVMPTQAPKEIMPDMQREADLRTARILVLMDEIRSLKEQIDQYREAGGELTAVIVPTQPKVKSMPTVTAPSKSEPVAPISQPQLEAVVSASDQVKCPHCGEMHPANWKSCPTTGEPMPPPAPTDRQCPHCGQMHPIAWKACPTTGQPLEPPTPKPAVCPHCGDTHPPEWKACPTTGNTL